MSDTVQEQLDAMTDGDLLRIITETLAKRQTPPTPEEQQAIDDEATYAAYFPGAKR